MVGCGTSSRMLAQVAHNGNVVDLLTAAAAAAAPTPAGANEPPAMNLGKSETALGPDAAAPTNPVPTATVALSQPLVEAADRKRTGRRATVAAKPSSASLITSEVTVSEPNGAVAVLARSHSVAVAGHLQRRQSSGRSGRIEQLFRAIEDGDATLVKFHLGLAGTPSASAASTAVAAVNNNDQPPVLTNEATAAAAIPQIDSPGARAKWIEAQLCHPLCQCAEKCARLQAALLQATKAASAGGTSSAVAGTADGEAARAAAPLPLDCRGAGGMTPLHVATLHGQTALVKLLLEAGAPVEAVTDQGR